MNTSIRKLPLEGALLLEASAHDDPRGSLSRFCDDGLLSKLGFEVTEVVISENRANVLRGLHYQKPFPQKKIVTCISGAIYDVIVDIRQGSGTFGKWHGETLSEKNGLMMYIPEGFAHGFLAMGDESRLLYLIDSPRKQECERGIRHNDKTLGIAWPLKGKPLLSERDRGLPEFLKAEKF